ncbi:hypothetical protein [Streptomyces noursei]|nr:hypothetical protein [Streptomyces noursei]
MEGRLDQPSLSAVLVVRAREQSEAEQRPDLSDEESVFVEGAVIPQ